MLRAGKFIAELRRRRVFRVALAYMVAAWLLIESSSVIFPAFLLPDWTHRFVAIAAVAAFPVVLILAWVFDISTRGIVYTEALPVGADADPVSREPVVASLPPAADSALASICILPFEVLSTDPEDEFLARGVGAEVASALGKLRGVRVVPRASTQGLGDTIDIQALGKRLDVRYVLSGSLRRQKDRIRINVEMADAAAGTQLWSETYHRVLEDVMQVEEDIAGAIVGSFGGEQLREQIRRANDSETTNPTAWTLVHKARSYVLNYNEETLHEAEGFARKALELDPDYAAAHATLADVLVERVTNGLSEQPEAMLDEAVAAIKAALGSTPNDPLVLKLAGNVWRLAGNHARAIQCLRRAVEIAPFDLGAWGYLGGVLAATDDAAAVGEAHAILDRILDMAPRHPGVAFWWHHKALACTCQGDFEAAATYARRALQEQAGLAWAVYLLANALQQTGDERGAAGVLERTSAGIQKLNAASYAAFVRRTSATELATQRRLAGLESMQLLSD